MAAAEEKLPVEVHALAACTENMPSGSSYKLGDVIRSLDGKTVEINNTDAEGRLTLADAFSYGLRWKPDAVLDFATLTGACMVALGPHIAGLMSNDDALANRAAVRRRSAPVKRCGACRCRRASREQLKSDIADLKNTGERWGGALTAGLFLKEFVGTVPWVHVDIAGPSSASKGARTRRQRRNRIRGGLHSRVSATRRSLNASTFASQPTQHRSSAIRSSKRADACVDSGIPA